MTNRFIGKDKTCVVAVGFDDNANPLLKQAVSLAQRTGMSLRLVHSTKALVDGPWTAYLPREFAMPGMAKRVEALAVEAANERLASIAANVPKDIEVSTNVVVDNVQSGIIADAVANRASMIFTATTKLAGGSFLHGFSEALSVASHSPIPVMICNDKCPSDIMAKKDLKLIVADDLEPHSKAAIDGTYEFVEALPGTSVNHVHVHGGLFDDLSDSFTEFLAKTWKSINPENPDPEEVLAEEFENRKKVLEERGADLEKVVSEKGGKFVRSIASGKISEELMKQADSFAADIAVFGRHQLVHGRPLSIGRLPLESIAAQNRLILVFPQGSK